VNFVIADLNDLEKVVAEFLKIYPKGGVFGLTGPLGVGKTTWVKAIVREMVRRNQGQMPRVISPSFVVHQSYGTTPPVEHFDFYRLELQTPESLIEIGYWDAFEKATLERGYVFVEWPEKANLKALKLSAYCRFGFGAVEGQRVLEVT